MFDNIGDTIKSLAKIICWIGIIACIIIGIVIGAANENLVFVGVLIAVIGSLLSWINSFFIYGFGQLIENSDIIAEQSSRSNKAYNKKVQYKEEQETRKRVKTIQHIISDDSISEDTYIDIVCPNCEEQLSYTKDEIMNNKTLICPMCEAAIQTAQYR